MSAKFDAAQYVAKWDRVVIPVMLGFITLSIIAVFAMNRMATPECKRNEYVYCEAPAVDHHGESAAKH